MRPGFALPACLVLLLALVSSAARPATGSETVNEAREALASGAVEEATRLGRLAIENDPECGVCWSLVGRALALGRHYREAEEALLRALELGDSDPATRLMLGSVLWENGSARRAEELLVELTGGEGRGAELARHELARLLLWQGRYDDAAALLEALVAHRPDDAEARLDLARALDRRPSEAAFHYRHYLAEVPDDAGAVYGLAMALRRSGEIEEADRWLSRYGELRAAESEALLAAGRRDASIAQARRLLSTDRPREAARLLESLPADSDVLSWLARAQRAFGSRSLALETLGRAVALEPGRADLRLLLQEWSLEPGDSR